MVVLSGQLREAGLLTDDLDTNFRSEAMRIVNEATDAVESAPYPESDDFGEHVYAP